MLIQASIAIHDNSEVCKKKVPQSLTQPASDLIMPYANDVLKRSSQSLTSSQLTYFFLVTVRVGETKLYQI